MVVIAILATIMIVSYNGIQQRSRDAKRESDITKLNIAIEKYKADNSKYPDVCGAPDFGCNASTLSTVLGPYLDQIPHDPKYDADTSSDYQYVLRGGLPGYGLLVHYEARPVCKTGVEVWVNWWGTDIPSC